MSTAAHLEIASVDWSTYSVACGPATLIGVALTDLLRSTDIESASTAWSGIEEKVFSQGTIYSAAEPTVSVLLAALTEQQPPWRSGRIADLLFFILTGSSRTDPALASRCMERAREGLWLLIRCATEAGGWERENLLEVLETVAPERIESIRAALRDEY